MATGFRPKYERTIELAGYSAEELMLLAIEASKSLGWQAGSIKRDKSDFYTPTSFRSWQEKVILSVTDGKDGQLLATSICTSMQFMDWGKNKQNLNKLTATMQQLQNVHNISPTEADTANKTTCAYTPEEKKRFEAYLQKKLDLIQLPNKDEDFLRQRILTMYANPAINHLKAIAQ